MTLTIIEKLRPIILLLEKDRIHEAKEAFEALAIVDTAEHLSLQANLRHLIWDMYEFLVLDNRAYSTKEEIIVSFINLTLK